MGGVCWLFWLIAPGVNVVKQAPHEGIGLMRPQLVAHAALEVQRAQSGEGLRIERVRIDADLLGLGIPDALQFVQEDFWLYVFVGRIGGVKDGVLFESSAVSQCLMKGIKDDAPRWTGEVQ